MIIFYFSLRLLRKRKGLKLNSVSISIKVFSTKSWTSLCPLWDPRKRNETSHLLEEPSTVLSSCFSRLLGPKNPGAALSATCSEISRLQNSRPSKCISSSLGTYFGPKGVNTDATNPFPPWVGFQAPGRSHVQCTVGGNRGNWVTRGEEGCQHRLQEALSQVKHSNTKEYCYCRAKCI